MSGFTQSSNYPTLNAAQPAKGDMNNGFTECFITKFSNCSAITPTVTPTGPTTFAQGGNCEPRGL